ncbi:MAG: glycosyltransferase [Burkholderiaceae bacterium]
MTEGRVTIVVLSYNRCVQLLGTLESLRKLPGQWPIIVVDNGSTDRTAAAVAKRFPSVMLIRSERNLGAAARNIGVAYAHTPYVAFSDDDTQWDPGALERAADLLDMAPDVGVLSACIHVGPTRKLDPGCLTMQHSPLARDSLPGPQLLGFMASACVMRTRAFFEVGGYWPPLFIGGEESLMALDMVEQGWRIIYAADVVTRHFPSKIRDSSLRQRLLLRNAIWVAWMRRPMRAACRETSLRMRQAHSRHVLWSVLWQALVGMPRALRRRRVISPAVEKMQRLLDMAAADPASRDSGRRPA